MDRPTIDHSLLSPSGRMSKRARAAAILRERNHLFPPGYLDAPIKTAQEIKAEKVDALRRSAANLRDLAARGMSRIKFTRNADRLEAEAARLESNPQ